MHKKNNEQSKQLTVEDLTSIIGGRQTIEDETDGFEDECTGRKCRVPGGKARIHF